MSENYWYNEQLRIVQTVLREIDAVDYDPKAVIDYLESVHANALVVNGGGVVDFFEHELAAANPNRLMTNARMLDDVVAEAHARDIRVIFRVDFRGVEKHVYDRMPHWFGMKADGSPLRNTGGVYGPCFNSVYMNDYATAFVATLFERFGIDGIWENALPAIRGVCYCPACRERYRRETGSEIPEAGDFHSEVFAAYRERKGTWADEHLRKMSGTVKSFGTDKAYVGEIFGMYHVENVLQSGVDLYNAREYFDFYVSPTFLMHPRFRNTFDDFSYAASNCRFMKSLARGRQVVMLYGNNGGAWRYVADPPFEVRLWLWEAVSAGAGLWNCLFVGQHPGAGPDRRNARIESDVYGYLEEHSGTLTSQEPIGEVGLFFSRASRDRFGSDDEDRDRYGVFTRGAEQALIESHELYRFLPDVDLSMEGLEGYRAVVLPNAACLSDEQVRVLTEYVEAGGGLVATFETSRYRPDGRPRETFGLAHLFGCDPTGHTIDTTVDSYQLVRRSGHELLQGLSDTDVLLNGGQTLLCTLHDAPAHEMVASYIPPIANQPPEKAWRATLETDYPTVVASRAGRGRVVYFANQVDRLVYTHGHTDFRRLFANAVRWAAGGEPLVTTSAPPSVHVSANRVPDGYVVHLVNTTLSGHRAVSEPVPLYDVELTVRLESGRPVRSTVLRSEGRIDVAAAADGEGIALTVSCLREYAAVHIATSQR